MMTPAMPVIGGNIMDPSQQTPSQQLQQPQRTVLYSNNIRVGTRRHGQGKDAFLSSDFLRIQIISGTEKDWLLLHDMDEVLLYRYCVPGRCDTYCFGLNNDGLTFSADQRDAMSLVAALAMLQKDLNRPKVVSMFRCAAHVVSLRELDKLVSLLWHVGSKTKSFQSANRILKARQKKRKDQEDSEIVQVKQKLADGSVKVLAVTTKIDAEARVKSLKAAGLDAWWVKE